MLPSVLPDAFHGSLDGKLALSNAVTGQDVQKPLGILSPLKGHFMASRAGFNTMTSKETAFEE